MSASNRGAVVRAAHSSGARPSRATVGVDGVSDRERVRVLVVDDDPDIHASFRSVLSEDVDAGTGSLDDLLLGNLAPAPSGPSYDVDVASQGKVGLELLRASVAAGDPYVLAFVDMRMPPGWDGIETTQALWSVVPKLLVVICTAYSEFRWEEISGRLGNADHISLLRKPFRREHVRAMARVLVQKNALAARQSPRRQLPTG